MEFLKQNRIVFFTSALLLLGFMQIIFPIPIPLHYVFIILSMLMVFTSMSDEVKINFACFFFWLSLVLSIAGNTIPAVFKPWERFALFSMLFIGCSPLISSSSVCKLRRQLTMGVIYALLMVAVLSFFGYFLGFGKRLTGIVNSYMGITGHPNFLGFYTMVSMVFVSSMFLRCTKMKERVVFILLWIFCLITLLLSSSRSALALGLVGTIIAVYLKYQKNSTALINTITVMVCLFILSLPMLLPYMEVMMKKNMNFNDTDSMVADTRGYIWQLRYWELEKSPIIGIGAYACDITLPNADVFYDERTGTIEQGSSYLGILAQAGWIGFLSFLFIAIPIIWKTIRYAFIERTPYAHLWLPIIFVIAANMLFEGYLITAGAVQCIMVWVTLAAADQCDKVADYPIFWERFNPITPQQYVFWRERIAEDGDKR